MSEYFRKPIVKTLMLKGEKGETGDVSKENFDKSINDLTDLISNNRSRIDDAQNGIKTANSRIDNLIVSSGSDSSAEVIDARMGYDGTAYDTLGNAIRTQIKYCVAFPIDEPLIDLHETFNGATYEANKITIPSGNSGIASYISRYINFSQRGKNDLVGKVIRINGTFRTTKEIIQNISFKLRRYDRITSPTSVESSSYTITKNVSGTDIKISIEFTLQDNANYAILAQIENNTNTQVDNKLEFLGYTLQFIPDFPYTIADATTFNMDKKNNIFVSNSSPNADFTKLKDAFNYVKDKATKDNIYTINIECGTYDLYVEQGGDQWANSITESDGQRQGLTLPNYCILNGIGDVKITCNAPNTITNSAFNKCVSTMNTQAWNEFHNLKFYGQNTRYVVHDENDIYSGIHKVFENCEFHRLSGNDTTNFSTTAYGGGTGSNSRFIFNNCVFEGNGTAFFLHNNNEQEPTTLILDGCYFNNIKFGHGISLGYVGKNTKHSKAIIKNCIYKDLLVHNTSGQGINNVWDVYNYVDNTVTIGE